MLEIRKAVLLLLILQVLIGCSDSGTNAGATHPGHLSGHLISDIKAAVRHCPRATNSNEDCYLQTGASPRGFNASIAALCGETGFNGVSTSDISQVTLDGTAMNGDPGAFLACWWDGNAESLKVSLYNTPHPDPTCDPADSSCHITSLADQGHLAMVEIAVAFTISTGNGSISFLRESGDTDADQAQVTALAQQMEGLS